MKTRLETSNGHGFLEVIETGASCRIRINTHYWHKISLPLDICLEIETPCSYHQVIERLRIFVNYVSQEISVPTRNYLPFEICDELVLVKIVDKDKMIRTVGKFWCEFSLINVAANSYSALLLLDLTVIDNFLENSRPN